jgi:trehalose-6-phosphate synthase
MDFRDVPISPHTMVVTQLKEWIAEREESGGSPLCEEHGRELIQASELAELLVETMMLDPTRGVSNLIAALMEDVMQTPQMAQAVIMCLTTVVARQEHGYAEGRAAREALQRDNPEAAQAILDAVNNMWPE